MEVELLPANFKITARKSNLGAKNYKKDIITGHLYIHHYWKFCGPQFDLPLQKKKALSLNKRTAL